ncbi:unnamed protein product [Lasius platythorax]|uniref:Uncharacterized protein n=1 Tax=Lasius platythorax TaxID=488582 RepID=A0AAV2NCH2_9HYME
MVPGSSRVKNNSTRPVQQSPDNSFHTSKDTFDPSNVRPATNAIASPIAASSWQIEFTLVRPNDVTRGTVARNREKARATHQALQQKCSEANRIAAVAVVVVILNRSSHDCQLMMFARINAR